MNRFGTALVAAAVLALAGCGGGGMTSPTTSTGDKPLTIAEVAAKVGCSGVKAGDVQVGTKEAAICTKAGHDVYLYTFGDDASRDNWMKIAKAAGALGTFEQGPGWVAQTV